MFTYGSALFPSHRILRRAGWGIYDGTRHPLNDCGMVATRSQTSYRGEVCAIANALTRSTDRLHIHSESEVAVRQFEQLLES